MNARDYAIEIKGADDLQNVWCKGAAVKKHGVLGLDMSLRVSIINCIIIFYAICKASNLLLCMKCAL